LSHVILRFGTVAMLVRVAVPTPLCIFLVDGIANDALPLVLAQFIVAPRIIHDSASGVFEQIIDVFASRVLRVSQVNTGRRRGYANELKNSVLTVKVFDNIHRAIILLAGRVVYNQVVNVKVCHGISQKS
jgi:hypothetical protein